MIEILRSALLGLVQGLTEFLPVSSSGHLEILNALLGSSSSLDSDLAMVILVHVGTALSILYVYRKDIWDIIRDVCTLKWTSESRLATEIIISMIPAMIIGLAFEEQLEELFSGGIWMVGISLIFTGLVLWATPNIKDQDENIGWKRAVLIGVAQAIAVLPGISRSGMTIAAALMLGVGKKEAARFSFLMVLPVILGKALLDIVSGDMGIGSGQLIPVLTALVVSFVVGVIACKWMIKLVQKSSLRYFAIYCVALGMIVIGASMYG